MIQFLLTYNKGDILREFYVMTKCSKCDTEWEIYKYNLQKKKTTLCAACQKATRFKYKTEEDKKLAYKHTSMMQRCYNKKHHSYDLYGGAGVTVSKEWLNNKSRFIEWSKKNGYKEGLHLDKDIKCRQLNISPTIYGEETCQYVSSKENQQHKSSTKYFMFNNESLTLNEWSIKTGIPYKTLAYRIELGWSVKKTLSTANGEIKGKPIRQLSIDGNVINEFKNGQEAENKTGICRKNISSVLRNKSKTAGGFRWDYKIQE